MVHNSTSSDTTIGLSRVSGGIASGFLELAVFHPVDTVIKRLMFNKVPTSLSLAGANSTISTSSYAAAVARYNTVIFKEHAASSFLTKYKSLFPGFKFALGYKVLQRTYKFGGQPLVYDAINNTSMKSSARDRFGPVYGKVFINGIAGACLGVGEVILLPLDVLKIKMQTGNMTVTSMRGIKITDLYKGGVWTALRNGPGSFALFGTSALVSYECFGLADAKQASFIQTSVASCAGAAASIIVAQPLDVIKTRIQGKEFGAASESGISIISKMIKNEGFGAFTNGLVPKLLTIGPKLAFSLTVAQWVMHSIQRNF